MEKKVIVSVIGLAIAAANVHSATVITPTGVAAPSASTTALTILAGDPGANIMEAVGADGQTKVFNINSNGTIFTTLLSSGTSTRFVMQDGVSGGLTTSGNLSDADSQLADDGQGVRFVVQELDADGSTNGRLGSISEQGLTDYVRGVSLTDPDGNGSTAEDDLGNRLDGDTSTAADTLNFGVQASDGTSGFVGEEDLTNFVEGIANSTDITDPDGDGSSDDDNFGDRLDGDVSTAFETLNIPVQDGEGNRGYIDEGTLDSYIRSVSRAEIEDVVGDIGVPVSGQYIFPQRTTGGVLLSSDHNDLPTFDGLRMDTVGYSNHYHWPRLYNVTSSPITISFQTFATQVNQNKTAYSQTVAPGGYVDIDRDKHVLWTSSHAEVITTNVRVHNLQTSVDSWFEAKWWAVPLGNSATTMGSSSSSTIENKKVFMSYQRML
ncbi:hypothetical protein OAS86_06615 [Gammaproteobacteria bacterium]|nr:hypothetical protein [Gammaproteobacteria bacterium]